MTKGNTQSTWTREEHILAFNLYCQIPFGTIHVRNPRIKELAGLLGRTPGAVSYKLANFSRLDPSLQARGIRGMAHGAKGEVEVWREFENSPESLILESQQLLAKRLHKTIAEVAEIEIADLPAGREREALIRIRVNQSFFRRRVLSLYDFRCCVTGLTSPTMLVASHIVPWSQDAAQRLNPRNGLCLNALHDRAFDRRMMWIDHESRIRFAKSLHKEIKGSPDDARWMLQFEGRELILPPKFTPDPELLRTHAAACTP